MILYYELLYLNNQTRLLYENDGSLLERRRRREGLDLFFIMI
jgi:hypothetical protein